MNKSWWARGWILLFMTSLCSVLGGICFGTVMQNEGFGTALIAIGIPTLIHAALAICVISTMIAEFGHPT